MEDNFYNEEISIVAEDFDNKYNLKGRTNSFANKCFDLCEILPSNYFNNHIKSQLFRCSTSVAANYRATCLAQSKPSFIAKISIVIEESDESIYWLGLIKERKIVDSELLDFLCQEAGELTSIFIKSRKTASQNLKNN
jgi:four helix bundle protein